MELNEMARRALPLNIALLALLGVSYAGIELTGVQASQATYYVIYLSLGLMALNFCIIYAIYRYRM